MHNRDHGVSAEAGDTHPVAGRGEPLTDFRRNTIHWTTRDATNHELADADERRGDKFRDRFPVLSMKQVEADHQGMWLGLLPVKVGDGFRFLEVRVVVVAAERAEFDAELARLRQEFPRIKITRRRIPRIPLGGSVESR
jgi:hypothetical protein